MSGPRIDQTADGAVLSVYVQPRARREGASGLHGDALKIALRAPPVDGAANKALVAYLGGLCSVPRSTIRILSGHSNRAKRVLFETLDVDSLGARVEEVC